MPEKTKNHNATHIRVYPEVKIKLQEVSRKLSEVQSKEVKLPETLRRIANIPNLKEVLVKDAEKKKKLGL